MTNEELRKFFEIIKNDLNSNAAKFSDISDTFSKLKRKVSGQKFKDGARAGW